MLADAPRRRRSIDDAPPPDALPERALRSAFDNAPIGIVVLTPAGVVTACNAALSELLGRAPHTLVGTTLFEVTHPADLTDARRNCALIQSGAVRILRHECRFVRPDGTVVWVLVSTSGVPEAADHPAHLIMHIEHIDDRKQLEAELTHQALHDPLTGLPNRTQLTTRLTDVLAGLGRHSRPTCLLYIDLDGFKAVNDRYGHATGDELLRQLGRRLTDQLRPGDLCARLGGDEFAVLCADTDAEQAQAVAERLRRTTAEPFRIEDREITLTAAVGIGTATSRAGDQPAATDLLREADERMYQAKRHRRGAPGKKSAAAEVRRTMTTPADRTITALRAIHDDLTTQVSGLTEEQLTGPSGATEWTVAQVLSHLGSGAEIALAGLTAAVDHAPPPDQDFNHGVWDRWNAMKPQDQAAGFVEHDTRLVAAYEALTAEQRDTLRIDLGFLPVPLAVASLAGMRLSEAAQHSWDVRVAVDPDATIPAEVAQLMAEHLAGDLGFMTGFIGKADALASPAVVDIRDSGFAIVVDGGVSLTGSAPAPTATFAGPLEAAVRLVGGRLTAAHTPATIEVTGNVTLDDLRRVFPGF